MRLPPPYRSAPLGSGVIRTADSAFVPRDLDNEDWRAYLEWASTGPGAQSDASSEDAAGGQDVETARRQAEA